MGREGSACLFAPNFGDKVMVYSGVALFGTFWDCAVRGSEASKEEFLIPRAWCCLECITNRSALSSPDLSNSVGPRFGLAAVGI